MNNINSLVKAISKKVNIYTEKYGTFGIVKSIRNNKLSLENGRVINIDDIINVEIME